MIPSSIKSNRLLKNIVLYGIIGCIASGTDALLFAVLYYALSIPWTIANIVSVIVGITISFVLNRRFNFKVMDHPFRRAFIFYLIGICGLVLSQLILWTSALLTFNMFISKLISIVIVAAFQFTLNKLISFGIAFSDTEKNADGAQ